MSEVAFDYPYLLALAGLLPLLAVLVLRHAYRQRRARLQRLGSMDVVASRFAARSHRLDGG